MLKVRVLESQTQADQRPQVLFAESSIVRNGCSGGKLRFKSGKGLELNHMIGSDETVTGVQGS